MKVFLRRVLLVAFISTLMIETKNRFLRSARSLQFLLSIRFINLKFGCLHVFCMADGIFHSVLTSGTLLHSKPCELSLSAFCGTVLSQD
jgi:hypothetical protein